MNLVLDCGNTRVKVGVFNTNNFMVANKNFSHAEAGAGIAALSKEYDILQSIMCNVAEDVPQMSQSMEESTGRFLYLRPSTALPIINAYETPESLGMDRLAAAVAAQHLAPGQNNLVIGIGTTVVYNFTTDRNTFRGGAISPGIDIRLAAMHQHTARLPLVGRAGDSPLIGYNTETSLRGGAINGVAHEIDGTIAAFRAQFKDVVVTITGGDSSLLARKLKSKIFADEFLTLKGLNLILNHNAQTTFKAV